MLLLLNFASRYSSILMRICIHFSLLFLHWLGPFSIFLDCFCVWYYSTLTHCIYCFCPSAVYGDGYQRLARDLSAQTLVIGHQLPGWWESPSLSPPSQSKPCGGPYGFLYDIFLLQTIDLNILPLSFLHNGKNVGAEVSQLFTLALYFKMAACQRDHSHGRLNQLTLKSLVHLHCNLSLFTVQS